MNKESTSVPDLTIQPSRENSPKPPPRAETWTAAFSNNRWGLPPGSRSVYLIRGGRAVLCPIFEGTYERRAAGALTPLGLRDREIDWSKEVERSFDYLETRPEIDANKLAFLGFSAGARPAVRLAAYPSESRRA
jgi:hypothetical protein